MLNEIVFLVFHDGGDLRKVMEMVFVPCGGESRFATNVSVAEENGPTRSQREKIIPK